MSIDSAKGLTEPKIFRSVRAAIVYDPSIIKGGDLFSAEKIYRPINVGLIPVQIISSLYGDDFDIIGVLGQSALDCSRLGLARFSCLKIGFYSTGTRAELLRGSLRYLTAAITCIGSRSPVESLKGTVYHFYESLTLPSLLNIDLADVESIARGTGISFNLFGDSSEDLINRLPSECYFARSALLHFTCAKNVTLDEVYRISKAISTRRTTGPFVSDAPSDQIRMYKRIRLKMGLRVSQTVYLDKSQPRISLTGILFGIKL